MFCKICNTGMKPLLTSWYCPNDCDKKPIGISESNKKIIKKYNNKDFSATFPSLPPPTFVWSLKTKLENDFEEYVTKYCSSFSIMMTGKISHNGGSGDYVFSDWEFESITLGPNALCRLVYDILENINAKVYMIQIYNSKLNNAILHGVSYP